MEIPSVDLNSPVDFMKEDQRSAVNEFMDKASQVAPAASQAEQPEEQKPAEQGDNTVQAEPEEGEDKSVPYKRFSKVFKERTQFKLEKEELENKLTELEEFRKRVEPIISTQSNSSLPPEWVEIYGANEDSQKAYQVWSKMQARQEEQLRQKILNEIQQQNSRYSQEVAKAEQQIEESFEELEEAKGKLTKKQREEVLKIVDEFTPKDEQGTYKTDPFPIEKAYEIYELRTPKKTSNNEERKQIAGLTQSGANATIEPTGNDFVPGRWDGWRKHVG